MRTNVTLLAALLALLALTAGCPVTLHRVPGDTELLKEPATRTPYYLYVPSWHRQDRQWPLVVTCHGTHPWDSALQQICEWRGLAEQLGVIVVAPELKAVSSVGLVPPERQLLLQQQDEKAILNIVRRAIAAFNVKPSWVFLTGWSGGGYDVYYTGLRNPNVFRALASRMGNFDPDYMQGVTDRLNPYQPVFVFFGSEDLDPIRQQCRQAADWLKAHGMKRVKLREVAGIHRRQPEVAAKFFMETIKKYTHVKLTAVKGVGDDPLAVQFYLDADPKPKAVVWQFGDGEASDQFEPQHRYRAGGTYDVKVTLITPRNARTSRTIKLELPEKQ